MPALTSSMWAPASTWAIVSRSTRLKSPAFISSARSFRPVGLIRSPMIDERPVVADDDLRVAEPTTVSVIRSPRSASSPARRRRPRLRCSRRFGVSSWAGGERRAARDPARLDQLGEAVLVVFGLEPLGLGVDLGLEVVAAGPGDLPPLLDVVVVGALAGAARGLVDRDLEARVEHDLLERRPSRAITWAGMSRHQITVSVAIRRAPLRARTRRAPCPRAAARRRGSTRSAVRRGSARPRRRPRSTSRARRARRGGARTRGPGASAAARASASRSGSSVWER